MMKKSAGILLFRRSNGHTEFFLVHPGGPFYAKKDLGVWTIPKGEFDLEEPLDAAIREFEEETGMKPEGPFMMLQPINQKSGKKVYAWATEGDLDEKQLKCNLFEMEWPPRSGKMKTFPEVDKGQWFNLQAAIDKILPAQLPLLDEVEHKLQLK
jgi:predicted NUDIX family NTP pyrophosphohydrolase